MYTYDCIEEATIVRNIYHTDSKYGSYSYSWNHEDHTFNYQLDQWGVDKLFHNPDEEIIRELKLYIEGWGNSHQEQEPSIKSHVYCKIWYSGSI